MSHLTVHKSILGERLLILIVCYSDQKRQLFKLAQRDYYYNFIHFTWMCHMRQNNLLEDKKGVRN
jgi:hypothetical protein